jgi:hypothetical protein
MALAMVNQATHGPRECTFPPWTINQLVRHVCCIPHCCHVPPSAVPCNDVSLCQVHCSTLRAIGFRLVTLSNCLTTLTPNTALPTTPAPWNSKHHPLCLCRRPRDKTAMLVLRHSPGPAARTRAQAGLRTELRVRSLGQASGSSRRARMGERVGTVRGLLASSWSARAIPPLLADLVQPV